MVCYHPVSGYRSRSADPKTGRRSIVFNSHDGYVDLPVTFPCGQCIGCRLERSRQWAIRCYHEAQLHEENCFITLTFADEHLPEDYSVDLRTWQLFLKRLRKRHGRGIRFFHCGEYGEKFGRPHYHACIFNFDFRDKVLWKVQNEVPLYTSEDLGELWPFGFSSVGTVTFQSAAYVARYIMKKITGPGAEAHYEWVDSDGVIHQRKPEYTTMSRMPGLGQGWLSAFTPDVYPSDYVVLNGKKVRPPKYYDRQYEITEERLFRSIRAKRMRGAKKHSDNNTKDRLAVRETVQGAKLNRLPRKLDD